MRLVYRRSGLDVQIGDRIRREGDDEIMTVTHFRRPHKPSSSGHVTVRIDNSGEAEYYVSVIGAEWIEREDRGDED